MGPPGVGNMVGVDVGVDVAAAAVGAGAAGRKVGWVEAAAGMVAAAVAAFAGRTVEVHTACSVCSGPRHWAWKMKKRKWVRVVSRKKERSGVPSSRRCSVAVEACSPKVDNLGSGWKGGWETLERR